MEWPLLGSPSSVTSLRPRLKAPKLRSSCNGCGISKVKCDRGHPVCKRCATLGLNCVYEPSRKCGKPPRKRLCAGSGRPSRAENREPASTIHFHDPTQANSSNITANIPALPYDFNASLGTNGQTQLSPAFHPSVSLEEWYQFDIFGSVQEIPSIPVSESASADFHSCPREAYEIFRDLICPSPFLHAPDSNLVTVSAQLDEVLRFNRIATNRLRRLLKCPCARTGHRAMVHASIVSRILIWYQQAAEWEGHQRSAPVEPTITRGSSPSPSPTPPLEATADTYAASTEPAVLGQATGFAVEHVPMSIGTFSIEDQNLQTAFRTQLILSELKKTVNLIDLFLSPDLAKHSGSSVAGLYSYLGTWLQNELSKTTRILRSRLSALNDDLDASTASNVS